MLKMIPNFENRRCVNKVYFMTHNLGRNKPKHHNLIYHILQYSQLTPRTWIIKLFHHKHSGIIIRKAEFGLNKQLGSYEVRVEMI